MWWELLHQIYSMRLREARNSLRPSGIHQSLEALDDSWSRTADQTCTDRHNASFPNCPEGLPLRVRGGHFFDRLSDFIRNDDPIRLPGENLLSADERVRRWRIVYHVSQVPQCQQLIDKRSFSGRYERSK